MAELITIVCDRHAAENVQANGVPLVITVNGETWRIDLCEGCEAEALTPLRMMLSKHGERVAAKAVKTLPVQSKPQDAAPRKTNAHKSTPGQFPCFVCDKESRTLAGLEQHFRARHGLSQGQAVGNRCPLCGKELSGGIGVTLHCATAHNVEHSLTAMLQARAEGDPHGVVAARVAVVEEAQAAWEALKAERQQTLNV